jgi:ATP-binding cassette, subfamily G (WHITE), member 2, SNQ2
MTGTIRSGEMLMVIGKPGSGCTTFLKTMANMHEEYETVNGHVSYGGSSSAEMKSDRPTELAFAGKLMLLGKPSLSEHAYQSSWKRRR